MLISGSLCLHKPEKSFTVILFSSSTWSDKDANLVQWSFSQALMNPFTIPDVTYFSTFLPRRNCQSSKLFLSFRLTVLPGAQCPDEPINFAQYYVLNALTDPKSYHVLRYLCIMYRTWTCFMYFRLLYSTRKEMFYFAVWPLSCFTFRPRLGGRSTSINGPVPYPTHPGGDCSVRIYLCGKANYVQAETGRGDNRIVINCR